MKYYKFLLCFLFLLANIAARSQVKTDSANVEAKISMTKEGEMVGLKAIATNNSNIFEELNYVMVAVKQGETGNLSNNKQQGKFVIKPNESKILSEINLNIKPDDQLKVYLFIRDEQKNKLVSKDSLQILSSKKRVKTIKKHNESSEAFRGMVLDNTKTKVGRDFFDIFYSQYSQLPDQYNFIINISEIPSRGRRGQISIESDDKTLYSFMTNPDDDYLKAQTDQLLKILKNYNQNLKLINKELIY